MCDSVRLLFFFFFFFVSNSVRLLFFFFLLLNRLFFEVGRAAVTSADSLTRGFGAAGT